MLLCVGLWCHGAASQESERFLRYSIANGLSQNTTYAIAQDSKGFIWIGTEDGLNRFDGRSFTVYRTQPDVPGTLLSGFVSALHVDRDGVLWVGTFRGGLQRFDPDTDTFVTVGAGRDDARGLSSELVWSITEDRAGNLWIATRGGGLDRVSPDRAGITHYRHDPDGDAGLASDLVLTTFEDRSGDIWIGTEDAGLDRLNPATGIVAHYRREPTAVSSPSSETVLAIFEDSRGSLWVGHGDGLSRLDRESGQLRPQRIAAEGSRNATHPAVYSITEDRRGALWLGVYGSGLVRLDPATGVSTRFHHDPTDPDSLSSDNVYPLLVDASGVLWIGTIGGGVSTLDLEAKRFHHIRSDPDDQGTLGSAYVSALTVDRRDRLWAGTMGSGLDRIDHDHRVAAHFRHRADDSDSLADDTVWSLLEDRTGTIWVGTRGGGLQALDPERRRFTRPRSGTGAAVAISRHVRALAEDHLGMLWIGTIDDGLLRMDPASGTVATYRASAGDDRSLAGDDIAAIAEDHDGTLWIGTLGDGLCRYDRETDDFTTFRHRPGDPASLSDDRVRWIHEDAAGALWLGTMSGLNRLDRSAMTFTRFTVRDGLPNNTVWGILEDHQGRLWISTNLGLSRFDPALTVFRNFDVHDGLQSNEFNAMACARSASGEMYFGGVNGITAFIPSEITDNPFPPRTVITGVSLFNRRVVPGESIHGRVLLPRPITETEEIELSYRDDVVTFEFAALHFASPTQNRFAYRLSGFERAWNNVGDRTIATYTSLPAGAYRFEVRSCNPDAVWDETGASLRVVVHPPFWATWWCRGGLAAGLLLIALTFHHVRTSRVRRRAAELEHLNHRLSGLVAELEAKNAELERFTYTVSHDLKSPLITIQGFLGYLESAARLGDTSRLEHDIARISSAADKMQRLLDELLELSRIGRIVNPPEPVPTRQLVEEWVESNSTRLAELGVDLVLADRLPTVSGDPIRLKEVVANLLDNAVQFCGDQAAPRIEVGVAHRDGHEALFVRDNGIGIDRVYHEKVFELFEKLDPTTEGTGVGLAIVKRIVEVHGGSIWVESAGTGTGATFFVVLPPAEAPR